MGSLRGTAWGSRSFFHRLKMHWFLQPEVAGTYLPGTGTLGIADVGLGFLPPKISLLNLYLRHMGEQPARSVSAPLLPVWMDVLSLIP